MRRFEAVIGAAGAAVVLSVVIVAADSTGQPPEPTVVSSGAARLLDSFEAPVSHDASQSTGAFDAGIAAGTDSVLVSTNYRFALVSKKGDTIAVVKHQEFFDSVVSGRLTAGGDPRIIWDPFDNRFWIAAQGTDYPRVRGGESVFFLAVSRSSDPRTLTPDDWHLWTLDTSTRPGGSVTHWADYTTMSVMADRVLLAANMFTLGDDVLENAKLRVIKKRRLLRGKPVRRWTDFDEMKDPGNPERPLLNLQPARHYPDGAGSTRGGRVGYVGSGSPCGLVVVRVTGSANKPRVDPRLFVSPNMKEWWRLCDAPLRIPQRAGAPDLKMPGAPFNERPVVHDGSLWVVASAHTQDGAAAGLRFAQVDVGNWPQAQFVQEHLLDRPGEWRFVPVVAVSGSGVLVAHAVASKSQLPAIAYTWRAHADPLGTFRGPRLLKTSATTFAPSSFPQLPDYFGAAVDPVDGTFWFVGQYAKSTTAAGAWVGHVEVE